jgi:hypothetical protein
MRSLFIVAISSLIIGFSCEESISSFLEKREKVEIASTECTDGTQVFGVYGSVSGPKLYVIKNGKIVYANESYQDVREMWSVYCLKNAILIKGINNASASVAAITSFNGVVQSEQIAGYNGKIKISNDKDNTIVNVYGGWQENENIPSETVTFTNTFLANPQIPEVKFDFKTNYVPAKKPGVIAKLTSMSTCYSHAVDSHYTVSAYVQNNGKTYIDITSPDDMEDGDAKFMSQMMSIPFVAKNSMCIDENTYIFGKIDNKMQAAKIFYNEKEKKFIRKLIIASNAPLQPYIR